MKRLTVALGVVFAAAVVFAVATWGLSAVESPQQKPSIRLAPRATRAAAPRRLEIPEAALESVRVARVRPWQRPTVGQTVHTLMRTTDGAAEAEESGASGLESSEQPAGSYATLTPSNAGDTGGPISGYFFTQIGDPMSRADQAAAGIAVAAAPTVSRYSGYFKAWHSGETSSAYYLVTLHLLRLPDEGGASASMPVEMVMYRKHSTFPIWVEVEDESTTLRLRPGQEVIYPLLRRISRSDMYRRAFTVSRHDIAIRAITVDKVG